MSCSKKTYDDEAKLQGDHSGCVRPPVDIKTNVAFQYMLIILKHNFWFHANGRFDTTWMVTLYVLY